MSEIVRYRRGLRLYVVGLVLMALSVAWGMM